MIEAITLMTLAGLGILWGAVIVHCVEVAIEILFK